MAAPDSRRELKTSVPLKLPVDYYAQLCVRAQRKGIDPAEYIGAVIRMAYESWLFDQELALNRERQEQSLSSEPLAPDR